MDNYQNPTWTRYIVSVGPASLNEEVQEGLIKAGANIFRSNFAHAQYEEFSTRQEVVFRLNKKLGTNVQIQADLQGPNIRVGAMPPDGVPLQAGQEYVFFTAASERQPKEGDLFINDLTLHQDIKPGEPITFMDGALEGEVTAVNGSEITVKMINSAALLSHKSVNVPETKLSSAALTEKDYRDLDYLLKTDVSWIAVSFIADRQPLDEVRRIIGKRPIQIISKIERLAALKNIDGIIDASDAVMIARGDLGIELPMEEVPIIQRELINRCHYAGKPVITATQMLYSMMKSRRPTRAEVSDVAGAVFLGSDAVMLSEETQVGVDPVNALSTMVRIARRVEEYTYKRPNGFSRYQD
ncbi:pyruvate kinase [Patescibacteria group bacterium]|nr:pyruvate kinase [Patescibacteria group bacterium]